MQLLDCELAQQAYEERLQQAERHHHLRFAVREPSEPAPIFEANDFMNQIKGWLSGRPRRESPAARRPRTV